MYIEGVNASTKPDFGYKMSITLKEANETEYCLKLILSSGIINGMQVRKLLEQCKELCRILSSIVKSSKI